MKLAIAAVLAALCLVAVFLLWPGPRRPGAMSGPEGGTASAGKTVPLAERDVTPSNMLPGPVVDGPLTRLPVAPPPAAPPQWQRFFRPLVLEAGLLDIGGRALRLPGIAVLPADAVCQDGVAAWPCGRAALTALRRLIRGRAIECRLSPDDAGDPLVIPCRVGSVDLARWLSETGWARPDANATAAIEAATAAARCAGRGLWRGNRPDEQCPDPAATSAVNPAR